MESLVPTRRWCPLECLHFPDAPLGTFLSQPGWDSTASHVLLSLASLSSPLSLPGVCGSARPGIGGPTHGP